jgi:hypothetical protein
MEYNMVGRQKTIPRETKKKPRDPDALLTPFKKELTVFGKVWTAMRTSNQFLIINPSRTKQYKISFKDISKFIATSKSWLGYEDDIDQAKVNLDNFWYGYGAHYPGCNLPWRWAVKYVAEVLSKEDNG